MDQDVIDGLTMVPGLVGSMWLAWTSNDFVYKIAVLAWGWVCVCSMVYHFSRCNPDLLKYDQRAQWVAQVFMILETPQSSWPIVVGGLLPVDWKTRMVLNDLGALYFAWHKPLAVVTLILSYVAYLAQYATGHAWTHSVFHILLHLAGLQVALDPYKKWHLSWIPPSFAWVVFGVGTWALLPPRLHGICVWPVRSEATTSARVKCSSVDDTTVGSLECQNFHALFRKLKSVTLPLRRINWNPRTIPWVPNLAPKRVTVWSPLAEDQTDPEPKVAQD